MIATASRDRSPGARRLARVLLSLVLGIACGSACSESRSPFSANVPRPSSQPGFTDPVAGASDVSPLPVIRIGYQDVLAAGTVSQATVQLIDTDAQPNQDVALVISLFPDGKGVEVSPVQQLLPGRNYEVHVLGRIPVVAPTCVATLGEGNIAFADGTPIDSLCVAFSTSVDPFLATTSPLPDAEDNVFYEEDLQGGGGTGSLSYAIVQGTLPGNMALSTTSGVISGTPSNQTGSTQTFVFTVRVSDTIGRSSSVQYQLDVLSGP